jgi:hypothetical protein
VAESCGGGGRLAVHYTDAYTLGGRDLCAAQLSEFPLTKKPLSLTPMFQAAAGEPQVVLMLDDGTTTSPHVVLPPEPTAEGATNGVTALRISPPGPDGLSEGTCFPSPGAPPIRFSDVYPRPVFAAARTDAIVVAQVDPANPTAVHLATCSTTGFQVSATAIPVPADRNAVREVGPGGVLVAPTPGALLEYRTERGVLRPDAGQEPVRLNPELIFRDIASNTEAIHGIRGEPGGHAFAAYEPTFEYTTALFRFEGACSGISTKTEGGR